MNGRSATRRAAWLTIAVQLGFVTGALVSSVLNVADVIQPRIVILVGACGAALANAPPRRRLRRGAAIPLRFLTGFFLAGVYPPALKLMATWFRRGRGTALGILVGALMLGSACRTSSTARRPRLAHGGLYDLGADSCGRNPRTGRAGRPYSFPQATFDPHQARRVRQPRRPAGQPRLLRPHVGALRHVGVVRRSTRRRSTTAPRPRTRPCGDRRGRARLLGRGILGDRIGRPETTARHGGVRCLRAPDRAVSQCARLGRARGRARVGVHGRGRLGPVLNSSPSTRIRPTSARRSRCSSPSASRSRSPRSG